MAAAAAVAAGACALPAHAADLGNLGLKPSEVWAEKLSDQEMAELRGGFNGLTFGVVFAGGLSPNLEPIGSLEVTDDPSRTQVAQTGNGNVRVQAIIGNIGGASGVFQITQVPGSFNVVNNNLIVQINLVQSVDQVPNLNTLLNLTQ